LLALPIELHSVQWLTLLRAHKTVLSARLLLYEVKAAQHEIMLWLLADSDAEQHALHNQTR
jgi:hypothetical protein